MGKRRNERRLAAKIGAGRRVKLDLFDEPSGELGGSSPKDEVENDMEAKHDVELPNSPSSGEQPANPLSLLGQYSDDELDDAPNKAEGEVEESKQTMEPISKHGEGEICETEDPSYQNVNNQYPENDFASAIATQQLADADALTSKIVTMDEKAPEADEGKQNPAPVASDIQTSGDVISSWKMVLHEESNRYYYWNTVTGETSWEIPDGLVQGTASSEALQSSTKDMEESACGDVYNATLFGVNVDEFSAGHGVGYSNGASQMNTVYGQDAPNSQSVGQREGDDNQLLTSSLVVGAMHFETSTLGNYILPEQYDGAIASSTLGSHAVYDHSEATVEQSIHLSPHLVKQSEALLENLKLQLGSGFDPDRHMLLSRYMSEIEVRLSDIRALLPYGSSLLPFWVHTERQLNQLVDSVNTEISGTHTNSPQENHVLLKGIHDDTKADTTLTKLSPEFSPDIAIAEDTIAETLKSSHGEVSNGGDLNVAKTSMSGPFTRSQFDGEGGTKANDSSLYKKVSSKSESQVGEDVDMDIDMEVEADTEGQSEDQSKLFLQPSTPMVGEPLVLEEGEFVIPPPPEEEFIPPPPPDDEGIPPPPPDEPPESMFPLPPPSQPEAVQTVYGELYNMNYAETNTNCYGDTTVPLGSSSYYEHPGSLPVYIASAQQPISMPNPVDTTGYYGLQDGSSSVVPLADTIGSSGSQVAVSFVSCDSSSSLEIPLATSSMSGTFSGQASSAAVVSAPATVSGKQHASIPSSSASETATVLGSDTSAAVSKGQFKASRMKKPKVSVGSSLRSNKKVSSLVDKWKAAKEELEEEEEQRETPLEILEKKRQREIEDWRAQQIASGEARENANFQPLGGNWRERVKRRKAQKEVATKSSSDPVDEGIKQPDLKALSKDLPLGWQVYWDDSSKQIYYSNSVTSETTWTRPTR